MIKNKLTFRFMLVLLIIVLVFYGRTLQTWFQQDEWDWIGRYIYYNSASDIPLWEAFKSSLFPHPRYRFTPFYDAFYAGLTWLFELNFTGYALTAILLHFINSVLVYLLAIKLTKKQTLSLIISILFATSSIGQKAVTWTATGFNTGPAFAFSVLSIIVLIGYINGKNIKITTIFIWAFIALWFKETALGVVLALPFIAYFLNPKNIRSKTTKVFFATTIFLALYFLARYSLSRIGLKIHTEGYPDFGRFLSLKEYLIIGAWVPFRALVDVFIFPNTLISIASLFRGKHDLFAETTGVDYVTIVSFTIISIFFFFSYKKIVPKSKETKNTFLVGLILIIVSIVTHLLLSVRGTSALIHILRSRDLYISTTGASIILSLPLYYLLTSKRITPKILGVILLVSYLSYHYLNINKLVLQEEISRKLIRKPLIEAVYSKYPKIGNKSIFYVESDTAYYGRVETSLPYQTGFGRTLLVWYLIKNEDLPPALARDDFLYPPLNQGYREIENFGFGFITDYQKLVDTLENHSVPIENIYAFTFTGTDNSLKDISSNIRKRLYQKIN